MKNADKRGATIRVVKVFGMWGFGNEYSKDGGVKMKIKDKKCGSGEFGGICEIKGER